MGRTIKLRQPATAGERTITELTFQDAKLRHLLATDRYLHGSHSADRALCSSLTKEPELILDDICPEDWADIRAELQMVYKRFFGEMDTFKATGDEAGPAENPQKETE